MVSTKDAKSAPGDRGANRTRLHELLQELGLPCQLAGDTGGIVFACQVHSTRLDGALLWHELAGLLELDLLFPFLVPTDISSSLAEAVVGANMALRAVRLDYDVPHRRLLLRAFHSAVEQPVSKAQLEFYLRAAMLAAELLYLPIQDVVFRGAAPDSVASALRTTDVHAALPGRPR